MKVKILTVDDSKTVRIIIKKAFKAFNCDIFEAQNGVEGLAMAAKHSPDIILLDITMPVMDGVEMLTKLKSDPSLKAIPVIMLTAEAGRDSVMKIAKIGIRDYIVKPFKEDMLVNKVSRVIELQPAGDSAPGQKKIDDPIDILVVEDKPAIIDQIKNGLEFSNWTVTGVASTGEAVDYCQRNNPDCIVVSLSLPDDAGINLFRVIRSNAKTKFLPIFGLSVKTELEEQQRAHQAGFSTIITKPINLRELESKIARAVNLDSSGRYFELGKDVMTVKLPKKCHSTAVNELTAYFKTKTSEAVDSGISNVIFDTHELEQLDMEAVKLLIQSMRVCQELSLKYAIAGNPNVIGESKKFEESKDWNFCDSVESAKATF